MFQYGNELRHITLTQAKNIYFLCGDFKNRRLTKSIRNKLKLWDLSEDYFLGWNPTDIALMLDLKALDNETEVCAIVLKLLEKHIDKAKAYDNGKSNLLGFFVAEAMLETYDGIDAKIFEKKFDEMLNVYFWKRLWA